MPPKLPLPRGWERRVKSSILHILALSHYSFTVLLARAALSRNHQVRLQAQICVGRLVHLPWPFVMGRLSTWLRHRSGSSLTATARTSPRPDDSSLGRAVWCPATC